MPAKKMGRPTDDLKKHRVDVRLGDQDIKTLDEYCKRHSKKRPEGIRDGVKALKDK